MRTDRYRRLFRYEQASHTSTLLSLQAIASDGRTTGDFQKAVDLLAHVIAARRMWLSRLGAAPPPPGGLFPARVSVDALPARFEDMHTRWTSYLDGLTDEDLDRTITYQSLDAGRFANTVEDILTQLYGHSLYHRGQVALLVRSLGAQPAATDFIYWSRNPVESSQA